MKKKTLLTIFTLIWCAVIYNFSSENSVQSSKTSHDALEYILSVICKSKDASSIIAEFSFLENIIRKTAHFSIFGILGILSYSTFKEYKSKMFCNSFCASVIFCAIYAVSDEVHQHFVPGRAMRGFDVLIDVAGAVVFIVIFKLIIAGIHQLIKNSKKT